MIDLEATSKITLYALLWGALLLIGLALLSRRQYQTTGLPFAFMMMYTVMHSGALVHLVEGYDHHTDPYLESLEYTPQTVADGLEASLLAQLGALFGILLAGGMLRLRAEYCAASLGSVQNRAVILILIGVAALILEAALHKVGIEIPGFQAIMISARDLLAVGALPIILYFYMSNKKWAATSFALGFAVLVPAVYFLTTAILADSVEKAVAIFAFFLTLRIGLRGIFSRNIALTASLVIVAFFFATFYLQMRGDLRTLVWAGGGITEAAQLTLESVQKFDTGSLKDFESLAAIDSRLNQNLFIGLAIEQLRILPETYESGDTIISAFLGWVPRFLWPDKPVRGGSAFLSKHTGREVQDGVTFGTGPIFEYYVNFAYWGVFLGFIVLAAILRIFDIQAIRALNRGNIPRFAQFYLAGLAMLQPLADLFFIVTGVASALIIGWGLRFTWRERRGTASAHRFIDQSQQYPLDFRPVEPCARGREKA